MPGKKLPGVLHRWCVCACVCECVCLFRATTPHPPPLLETRPQVCKNIKANEENCLRARRRASVLVPLLTSIWRRVSADPTQMQAAVHANVKAIADELEAQVPVALRLGVFVGCVCARPVHRVSYQSVLLSAVHSRVCV